jgi:hypothetical protein
MWFECQHCNFAGNSPKSAADHEAATGHWIIANIDWTENEEVIP